MVKIKRSISIALLLIGALIMVMGCAEDESPVTPTEDPLQVTLISPTGVIPYHGTATYSWTTRGGAGSYNFSYTFGNNPAVQTTNSKVTFEMLESGSYTFSVTVTDAKSNSVSANSGTLTVLDFDSTAIVAPVLSMTLSPEAGRDVPTLSPVTFSWEASDASPEGGIKGYEYIIENVTDGSYIKQTDTLIMATTVTFDSLTVGDYDFTVTVTNEYDLTTSEVVSFSVHEPYIMWMDDHYLGSLTAEFIERNHDWGAALNGFAWSEFDVNDNYTTSTETCDLLESILNDPASTYETIIWDESGTDDFYLMWYSTNGIDTRTPWLTNFLDNGGNAILIGSNLMGQIYVDASVPPAAGDFEDMYMGMIPDSVTEIIDMTVSTSQVWDPVQGWITVADTTYDTSYVYPYADNAVYMAYDGYTTLAGTNGYTNISIDVAKDGSTHQGGIAFYLLKPGIKPIFLDDAGDPVGYIYDLPGTTGKVAILGMNLYFSPAAEIRLVLQKILAEEFGH